MRQYNYIYELFDAPCPAEEWALAYDLSECPGAFPIAERIGEVEDREAVIAHFGAWLEENRLGTLDGEAFTIGKEAADRYFEGHFAVFQYAVKRLQALTETQFVHEHDGIQKMLDLLGEAFTHKHGDYVLWNGDTAPAPLEEFLRKAQPGIHYYIGAVLNYSY